MDEVDGMAGNEDRGGIAELIQVSFLQIKIYDLKYSGNHLK
jgi:hypothetical protein